MGKARHTRPMLRDRRMLGGAIVLVTALLLLAAAGAAAVEIGLSTMGALFGFAAAVFVAIGSGLLRESDRFGFALGFGALGLGILFATLSISILIDSSAAGAEGAVESLAPR